MITETTTLARLEAGLREAGVTDLHVTIVAGSVRAEMRVGERCYALHGQTVAHAIDRTLVAVRSST